jgi:hypothetical protein
MKKVFTIAVLALFVACKSQTTTENPTVTDSTTVDSCAVDTCKTACDTTKAVDTAK